MSIADQPKRPASFSLGHLEIIIMEILWGRGESSVHDVMPHLQRPLAYTTVMTTLDRLFKKGLLTRRKSGLAFFYLPSLDRPEWERKRAGDFVTSFLAGPQQSIDSLISGLVEAVSERDAELLAKMEEKIRMKRKELSRRPQA